MRGTAFGAVAVLLACVPAAQGQDATAPVSTRTPARGNNAAYGATMELVRRVARAGDPSAGGSREAVLKAVESSAPRADLETLVAIVSDPEPPFGDASLRSAALELLRGADKKRAGPFVAKGLSAARRPGEAPTPELVRVAGEVGGPAVESAAVEQLGVRGADAAPWLKILGAAGTARCLPAVYDRLIAARNASAAAGPVACAQSVIDRLTDPAEKKAAIDALWAKVDSFRLPHLDAMSGVFAITASAGSGPVATIGLALTGVSRRSSDDDQEAVRILECLKSGWRALASIGSKEAADELLKRLDDERAGDARRRAAILSAMVALGGKRRDDKALMQSIVDRMGTAETDKERDGYAQVLFTLAGEVVNYHRDVEAWRAYVSSLPAKK
ncbi:MAG TPA: hypothetical protein VFF73_36315 [Planctomycetota bacterium]|nr:hypothetical protein [Planctomycetota bacterium]